ncbi:hypothetical protein CMI37_14145 [Candidatus Pacearchaeota archaeon]|nr:hypothetical protein [Candidatus Pacearchaeota archaeon]
MNFNDLREYMRISVEGTANSFSNDVESFIGLMSASGVNQSEIKNILRNDLTERGRIFGSLKNNSASTIRNGMENASNVSTRQAYEKAGIKRFRWVSAGGKVCPDCENRAGVVGEMGYFDSIGLPKSGFSVCGRNCQCQLVPVGYKTEGNIIRKEKPKKEYIGKGLFKAGFAKTKASAQRWAEANQKEGKRGYKFGDDVERFRGSVKKYNNYNRYKSMTLEQCNLVNELLEECNKFCDDNRLPRIRGVGSDPRNSVNASMGDGLLNINKGMLRTPDHIVRRYTKDASEGLHSWSVKRHFVTLENNQELMTKSTFWHEIGHHVHQQKGIFTKDEYLGGTFRSKTPFEKKISSFKRKMQKELDNFRGDPLDKERLMRKIFPSQYSMKNEKEWFAECFSLFKMGRKDLLHPKFLQFLDDNGIT